MKSWHIIQVSAYYPPHLGGQEYAVQALAGQLAGTGHRVDVIASSHGTVRGKAHENGVNVVRLGGYTFGHAPIMPRFPGVLCQTATSDSIVHLHIGQAFTPEMVWLASKLRRFRYIAQLHIDFKPSGPAGILLPLYKRLVLGRVLRAAAQVVTLNRETQRHVKTAYGCTAKILNNGIDETYFTLARASLPAKPPRVLRLLFVGRLAPQKNCRALLEALTRTPRTVQLDIIGGGESRPQLETYIARHKLANVTLHGQLAREEILHFYATSHALVMPSLYEAQPLVLLEAMAARLPIIATRVTGVAEHIQGAGILIEPTATGIADGINQYYTRYSELPGMIERAYTSASSRRWPQLLQHYEKLYAAVANN